MKTNISNSEALSTAFQGLKDGTIIDTHNGYNTPVPCAGVAILRNGNIVALFENVSFCLNAVVVDENGTTKLTPWSVAGNVYARNCSLEEAIKTYNSEITKAIESGWATGDGGLIESYMLVA